jgi:hypothetical protein
VADFTKDLMPQRFLDREGILIVSLAGLSMILIVAAGVFLWAPPGGDLRAGSDSAGREEAMPSTASSQSVDHEDVAVIEYPGEAGSTVLDLLKREHAIALDTELLLFGSIVLTIDSFTAGPNELWTFYRDGIPGDRSPDECTTFTGETIRWVLRSRK